MHTTWPSAHALLIGSCFSLEPREVKVHSVFHSALNLIDEQRMLYTLVMHKKQLHPSCALVSFTDPCAGFDESAFTQAREGKFEEGSLSFDCGIWVSCKGAQRIHPSEEAPPKLSGLEASYLLRQMKILSLLQQEKQTALTVDALFSPSTGTNTLSSLVAYNARLLGKSIQSSDSTLARRGIEGLLGLGPGSTPSGDDFLCGFLLALHMSGPSFFGRDLHTYFSSITTILSGLIRKPIPITTDISMQLLGLASEGLFSQPLIAMAKAFSLLVADRQSWEALADFGYSSGLDAGLGFLFALSVLLPDFEYKGELC
jgi:cytochrome c553